MTDDTSTDLDAVRERADEAARHIADLCQGKRRWTMTVPVDLERDDDVILSAVVGDARQLAAEVERLRGFVDDCLFGFEDPNGELTAANLDVLRDRAMALMGSR